MALGVHTRGRGEHRAGKAHGDERSVSMSSLPRPYTAAEPPDSLVDEFLEGYIYWIEACEDVRTAYQRWQDCTDRGRGLEYERYTAALDHEEYAADLYSYRAARLHASGPSG